MASTEKYKYNISLQYMKTASKKYITIEPINIEYVVIDRDYDNYNMPLVYIGLNLDKNIVDDMILNEKNNLINLEVYKFRYDDSNYIQRIDELYIRDQCTYFIADDLNPNKDIDYPDNNNEMKSDIYRRITIGLMKLSIINDNKIASIMTFDNTSLTNAVRSITNHIPNILIEPLTYGDVLLNQITVGENSVAKNLNALNKIKVFYSSPYRFFIDFDTAYLLSSRALEVPKKGEKITCVLICIKKPEDYIGMDDGMYTNKSQGNYQINVNSQSTAIYTDRLTDKIYNNITAITNSGDSVNIELNIDRDSYSTTKTKKIIIPNDNIHMIDNIKAETENSGVLMTVCKESIDTTVFTPNHRIIVKHIDTNVDKDGDYIMAKKKEIFVRDGYDFILSTMVNLRKIR